jgi:hypothetical protein
MELKSMVRSEVFTIEEYLEELDPDRRTVIVAIRECVLRNLQEGYDEQMQWGMITYEIPLQTFPDTYNKQPLMYADIASQKRHMSVYLMNIYGRVDLKEWFEARYRESGKKLDIGKACVRFKILDDVPLELIGEAISRRLVAGYLEIYRASRSPQKRG